MPSGIDLARDRIGHAASQGPATIPVWICGSRLQPRHDASRINPALAAEGPNSELPLSLAPPNRTNLPDRAPGKRRAALSHSKAQLPCFHVLPHHFATEFTPAPPGPLRHSSCQLPCFDNLPHSFALRAKSTPLFSETYKSLFPQTLSFDILTKRRGVYPPRSGFSLLRNAQVIFFQYLPHSFRTLLRSRKYQPPCFHCLAHSFTKTPGWGGLICRRRSKMEHSNLAGRSAAVAQALLPVLARVARHIGTARSGCATDQRLAYHAADVVLTARLKKRNAS